MYNLKLFFVAVLLITVVTANAKAQEKITYIDVTCDGNGSANEKIDKAIKQASATRRANADVTLAVRFSSGLCRLDRPIILTQDDSGAPSRPFLIEGAKDGGTIITGAFPTTSLGKKNLQDLLPADARRNVIQLKLSNRATTAYASEMPRGAFYAPRAPSVLLLQGGQWLHMARWPDNGYAQAEAMPLQKGPIIWPTFHAPNGKIASWTKERDLWLGGYWTWDWVYETLKVATVDPRNGIIMPTGPLKTKYDESRTLSYFVYNAASELTEPGEYVIDGENSTITVWPHPGVELQTVESSRLLEVHNAHDIQINHIVFRGALDTAILINHSDRVSVKNCLISIVGKIGIAIEAGQDNNVVRTVITNIGETAIALRGGDRETLKPAGHIVIDSIITRYGLLTRTYRPAVDMSGVGITIEGSLFEDGPFDAIMFQGNDNIIRNNEFAHVVREAGDAGAVYSGRNVSWRGNSIEGNYFHDIVPDVGPGKTPRGVYLDDFVSGNRVINNVFFNVTSPVYIHGGSANAIRNNFFACVRPDAIHLHNNPNAWIKQGLNLPPAEAAARAGIPISSIPLYRSRYPDIDRSLSADGYIPKNNSTEGNIVAGPAEFVIVGEITESLAQPERIEPLSCYAPAVERSQYLAKEVERLKLKLADRRTALRDIPYYHEAIPK